MKKFILSSFFFLILNNCYLFAQSGSLGGTDTNPNSQHLGTTAGIYLLNSNSKEKIKKIFLFDNFNNKATIYDKFNKKYKINNFNVDLISNSFVSQVNIDTLFTFTNLSKVILNNREFLKKDNFIHEKIVDGDKINFYVKYFSKKKEQEFDKMNGKLIKPEHYISKKEYVLIDNIKNRSVLYSRLKKKKIIELLSEDLRDKTVTYAKDNKLSFKDPIDLKKILRYYNSI